MSNYLKLVSIEIGNVADNVITAVFSNQIVSYDFSAGITAKVNGVTISILSVKRLNDQRTFQYIISQSVISTDTVTFKYLSLPPELLGIVRSSMYGDYTSSELGVVSLEDIGTLTVTNNVPSNDPIGDALRADAIAYWKMDETSGTRVDSKGNNNLDQLNSVGSGTGKINNGLVLNGDDDYARFSGTSLSFGNVSHAFAFWVKFSSFPSGTNESILMQVDNEVYYEYLIGVGDVESNIKLLYDDFAFNTLYGNTNISIDTWYFVVSEYDATANEVRLFLDNSDDGSFASSPNSALGNLFVIGRDAISGLNASKCVLDEVLVKNGVFTSDERAYLFNSGTGRTLYP